MSLETFIGFPAQSSSSPENKRLLEYTQLKLSARGFPPENLQDYPILDIGRSLLHNLQQRIQLLAQKPAPVDLALHEFLTRYLGEHRAEFPEDAFLVPTNPFILERHGIARLLSLPEDADTFQSSILSSYRLEQGVLHNPASDRRTTEGVFHVAEGGLPIPADKKAVPLLTFARLLRAALEPPDDIALIPFTANRPEENRAKGFVSLLLRPVICPEVPGVLKEKTMEIRFFAPGNLVSNLDFVESIFGNAGDPYLPENDARLDPVHWSGHTGMVILAPHLIRLTKKELGLPHIDDATPRQKRDGMCWSDPDEKYNEGGAFKVTARDLSGTMVTLIADNYYGYCKKEVKTQISFAANLYGLAEEEHAGGALAFPRTDLGEDFTLDSREVDHTWEEQRIRFADLMDIQPEGYGIDKKFPDILYLPETAHISLSEQIITWPYGGKVQSIRLLPGMTCILPSGYKVEMGQPGKAQRWRLVGENAEGTFCHKPCTVSGGGKSEISKSLSDAMVSGPVVSFDFQKDLALADEIINRDYGDRFKKPYEPRKPSRPLLSPQRSFGSVARMLQKSDNYTDAYNAWLESLPKHVIDLVLVVKRRYNPSWGKDWQSRFSVDIIDGKPGIELKYRNQKLVTRYLRVGFDENDSWRIFGLRKDFAPAQKRQREDDITSSVTLPEKALTGLHPNLNAPAYKFAANCEYRLFQRPDDAIHRGYDANTERDFSKHGNFFSNYEPIPREAAKEMVQDTLRFGDYTQPMQNLIQRISETEGPRWFVSSSEPRLVNGTPTKNPRYLQPRQDLEDARGEYLAEVGARLYRRLPSTQPLLNPVSAVLPGRRNSPRDGKIRSLAVYGPIHYQELPELFMEWIASLTGKSPSTTGAGSEGALTKAPFNALPPIIDLNNALVSLLLTQSAVFTSAAGYVGPKFRVDHDISLLVPEVWSRMHLDEREPAFLIREGCLEKVEDFTHEGRLIPASRLGWRITETFVERFFGRVFGNSSAVFTQEMLRPELQDLEEFVEGMENIAEAQQRVALQYFEDGSIEQAIPPLKALLTLMAQGDWEGKQADDPAFRALFTREAMIQSAWYQARLDAKLARDLHVARHSVSHLQERLKNVRQTPAKDIALIQTRLETALSEVARLESASSALYQGTLGLDPHLVPN